MYGEGALLTKCKKLAEHFKMPVLLKCSYYSLQLFKKNFIMIPDKHPKEWVLEIFQPPRPKAEHPLFWNGLDRGEGPVVVWGMMAQLYKG